MMLRCILSSVSKLLFIEKKTIYLQRGENKNFKVNTKKKKERKSFLFKMFNVKLCEHEDPRHLATVSLKGDIFTLFNDL